MSDNILELKHITKLYPGVVALNDVSLEVRRGEILALVGENGAGKSTLIKTCSVAITPTQGEIVINGKSFTGMTPQTSEQNGIGVIYQEFNLVGDLSVAENKSAADVDCYLSTHLAAPTIATFLFRKNYLVIISSRFSGVTGIRSLYTS